MLFHARKTMLNLTYNQQDEPQKNNLIQIFRALAIIAVIMIHTTPPGEWQIFCRPLINFSVATFLFLSGYLTKTEQESWFVFCKKRIIRVIIPYIVWTILYSLPVILNLDFDRLFKNLLTAKASVPLYYIFVYIQFVVLTPFLSKLAKSKYKHIGWAIAPVSILIFKYYGLLTGFEYNGYVTLAWTDSCLGWFTFYYLGLLLGNRIIERNYSIRSLFGLYILSIILQIAEGYGWLLLGDANCGTQLKLTSLLTSSLFLLIIYASLKEHISINSKFLRLFGDYSFGIYLCHIMVMMILSRIPYYSSIPFPINSAVILLISLGVCLVGTRICGPKISRWLGFR